MLYNVVATSFPRFNPVTSPASLSSQWDFHHPLPAWVFSTPVALHIPNFPSSKPRPPLHSKLIYTLIEIQFIALRKYFPMFSITSSSGL